MMKINYNKWIAYTIMFITMVILLSIIGFFLNRLFLAPNSSMATARANTNQLLYYEISEEVNGQDFDFFTTGDIHLNSGKIIIVGKTQQYPDDVIVSYGSFFNKIYLEVENDNGKAKVVAFFDERMKEISAP